MTIREYLNQEARRITDGGPRDCRSPEEWQRTLPARRARFLEMMGLSDLAPVGERPPVPVTVTGVVERDGYRIEKLAYESLPKLYVTANLYVPSGLTGKAAAVLYVCGHGKDQKVWYQAHARKLAQLGFVTLLAETIQLGEAEGHHHGTYREGWFHWYSRGYTPAGVELLNGIRGLDLLAARPDVDGSRLGVTGTSGGGATSWWVAAADERIKAAAPSCGTATLASHIADRTIDDHCDCMWWVNLYGWDLTDIGALIAPRPLLIASTERDELFTIAAIREVYERLQPLYASLGAADNLRLVTAPGPHSYQPQTRTAIFSWLARHLQGRDIPLEEIGDIDGSPERQEPLDALRVFVNGIPLGNRALTIQDELVRLARPPTIANIAELQQAREHTVRELLHTTFAQFPVAQCPPLDARIDWEFERRPGESGCRFGFTSEEGWRLRGVLVRPANLEENVPLTVALRGPHDKPHAAEELAGRMGGDSIRVVVEPRGTGDTAWGEDLDWHVRRAAAWTGRTVASMRVWDTLRALAAVRDLPNTPHGEVTLAASREMCAVALYAALLDGQVSRLHLESPPATQHTPSQPDGCGPAIEMLGCLRITDLPYIAGLLYPAQITVTSCPDAFGWAKDLYARLGPPGAFSC